MEESIVTTYHVALIDDESLLYGQAYVNCYYNPEMEPYVDPKHWAHTDVACYLVYNMINTANITALMLLGKVIAVEEQFIAFLLKEYNR